ncbi:MAG: cytochrome c [Deltaproteobacteria bacterium]|nr:cytochrome c [Deltaproteobacteria bacterium]
MKTLWIALALMLVTEGVKANVAISLPEESAVYRNGPGVDMANAYCMGCHSADYVLTQPPGMPRAFWTAEVKKMKEVFGAPVPDDQVKGIVDYLVNTYGDARKK